MVLLFQLSEELKALRISIDSLNEPARTQKPPRPEENFANYIRVKDKEAELLAFLHDKLEDRYRVDALVYLVAAIKVGVLSEPPFKAADAEFPGHMGSDSLYNEYLRDPERFEGRRRKAQLEEAMEEIRKIL